MTETLSTIFVTRPGRSHRRVGRGIGSGRGKTSGYGHKGARARAGGTKCAFEGGQMPIYRRLPKRGFTPLKKKGVRGILNIQDLQRLVDAKKIKNATQVTLDLLRSCGAVQRSVTELRILGKGKISTALKIEASYVTPSAVRAIVAAGGEIISKGDTPSSPEEKSPPKTFKKQETKEVSNKKIPKMTSNKTAPKPHSAEQEQQAPAPQKKVRQRKKAPTTVSEEQADDG